MYNRYIPQDLDYHSQEPPPHTPTGSAGGEKSPFSLKGLLSAGEKLPWRGLLQGEGDPLEGLLHSLKLEGVDSGDILLVLLILFLLIEGDDQWELIITLGLLLIMGLTEDREKD